VPSARTVSPHAIAFDGSRWHIRAYCHQRQDYRDFVFARILEITLGESSAIDPTTDLVWQREIEAVIEPHPALPPAHRRVVELDYGMTDGRLILQTREALLLYVLRHMALLHEFDEPAWSNYLILANRDALKPFFESHDFFGPETAKDQ
jgi:predicted DNA-binding transcriptional regulator YafY